MRAALVLGTTAGVVSLVHVPVLSDDLYRYAWDGQVQAAGTNPYRYPPADPALSGLRQDWLWPSAQECAAIGKNAPTNVPKGGTAEYTYFVPPGRQNEGAHYLHPGPGNRAAVSHGLWGALMAEPTGSHYLNADTTAFMQFMQMPQVFKDFPTLRIIIPHAGGAVPYHWGRFRGLAQALGRPEPEESLLRNVFFDTCVYHQPGIDLLLEVMPVENVLFASEMVGAVRGVDPRTGHHFDDTRRYVEKAGLTPEDLAAVEEGNARRVYPRLDARLTAQGR